MTTTQRAVSPLGLAQAAVDAAFATPARARRLAARAIAAADGHAEPRAVAERALGMADVAVGDLAGAETHLRAAIRAGDGGGAAHRAAEARGMLAYVLSLTGRTAAALHETELAAPALAGVPAARLSMQRALVLSEAGRFDEAADGYARALEILAGSGGDGLVEADIRNNRSLVHLHRRDWRAAEADLARAEALYLAAGQPGKTAPVLHNRGLAAAVCGDLPAALRAFDEAERRYREHGRDPGLLPVERAETLLSVPLVAEARAAAEAAVAQFAAQRNAIDLVQARLVLARAALLAGDHALALDQATRAERAARRQQRPGWAALGGYLALRARWDGGRRDADTIRAGRRSAAALDRAGWAVEALDARLIVARTALERDRPDLARRELAGVSAATGPDATAELRARARHADALLRLAEGDLPGADAALRAGLRIVEAFRASLGATELRVHAAGHGGELARLGMRLALDRGSAAAVLAWTERWRARALMHRPARPADDAALARDLAELRQVSGALAAALTDGTDPAPLRTRQAAIEETIRRRTRRADPAVAYGRAAPRDRPVRAPGGDGPSAAALRAALGDAVLIELLAVDGELHAVTVTGARTRLHALGPVAPIEDSVAALRHGLRRIAHRAGADERSRASVAAAGALVDEHARRLDAALIVPLAAILGAGDDHGGLERRAAGQPPVEPRRPVVIVPTGALHALPWAVLPSMRGRPVCVTPSAALWHRAATAGGDPDGRQVFVAGPGLPQAAAEVEALARRAKGATRLTGRRAGVEAVTRALDGAGLAHVAAHGLFRDDNPQFSALRLVDGPLTVYDLERLHRPPRDLVLSACESGLSAVRPGDELLGLTAALLGMGSRSLVAAVVPVPDAASRPLMLRLHRHLRAGAAPAVALARAQETSLDEGPAERAAAAGFLCYGAGLMPAAARPA